MLNYFRLLNIKLKTMKEQMIRLTTTLVTFLQVILYIATILTVSTLLSNL